MSQERVREVHPNVFEPSMMLMNVCLSFFGAIIGLQIITTLGVTPNTAIIGVLVALIVSRIPLASFAKFRNIHRQNMAQTAISSATFGAANSLLLPVAIPFVLGRVDLAITRSFDAGMADPMTVPVGENLPRNASCVPPNTLSKGDPERGKSDDSVRPTTYRLPELSTATPLATSEAVPPRYDAIRRASPLADSRSSAASSPPASAPWEALTTGKSLEDVCPTAQASPAPLTATP